MAPTAMVSVLLLLVGLQTGTTASVSPGSKTIKISRLPDVFSEPKVQDNLRTGLSTTLVASAVLRDRAGADHTVLARARIRFDLWDEVFLVDSVSFGGDGSLRFDTEQDLRQWWRKRSLTFGPGIKAEPTRKIRLRLVVLPFSESEEQDARLWFSRSVRSAGTSGLGDKSSEINTLLEQVMATSIRRDRLLSFDLKLPVAGLSDLGEDP